MKLNIKRTNSVEQSVLTVPSIEDEIRHLLKELVAAPGSLDWRGWLSERMLRMSLTPADRALVASYLPYVVKLMPYAGYYHMRLGSVIRRLYGKKRLVSYDALARAIAYMCAASDGPEQAREGLKAASMLGTQFVAPEPLPYVTRKYGRYEGRSLACMIASEEE